MTTDVDKLTRPFLTRMAALAEELGFPATSGRVLGWLLTCTPPCQTVDEIAAGCAIGADEAASILTALNLMGTADRISPPGGAAPCYALKPIEEMMDARMCLVQHLRREFDLALAELATAPPETRERLEELVGFYGFVADEMPHLLSRWRATRQRASAS